MTGTKSGKIILDLITAFTLILGIILVIPVYSQVVGGTLSGTITDASGAAVPNAAVSIKNVATGVITNVKSNAQGVYNAPNLLPGTYAASITGAGFDTAVASNVVLNVGAQQVLNVSLKVGTISERVQVSEIAPDLQLASSTISGSIDSNTVLQLPLNGRSWTDLATLQPGVSTIRAIASVSSPDRLGRGLGVQLSVTGGRPQQNNYLMNGVSINDYSNQSPGSILGGNLGVDAVAEFSVLTTNYSAEYGRTSGGVISAISRTGTNQFHGSAFEFLRNSALDARNTFDFSAAPGLPAKPAFRRNQFGVSAGGPIRKDKTFIFGAYEGLRQSLGLSMVDNVPSLRALQGTLCDPDPKNLDCSKTIPVKIDSLVQPYLAFFPKPNGPLQCPGCVAGAGDTALFTFGGSQITSENYFSTRIDHKISEKDNLSGSYMFDNSPSSQTDEFNNKILLNRARRQLVTMEENHVFSGSLGNSFRVGYSRVFAAAPAGSTAVNKAAADTSKGFIPGQTVGVINVPGLTLFSGGLSTAVPAVFHWNSWQAYDNVFLTKGTHSLKFGANVERIQNNQFTPSRPGGEYDFGSLQDFLTNNPNNFTADKASTPKGVRETIFGAYVQDDFHYRPNLTLTLGLRYEMATVPTEVHGQLASLQNLMDTAVVVKSPLFANPSLRNFEPRLGFSWDPFRNGKTAVRGGFGMFDVLVLPANLRHTVDGTVPFSLSANGVVGPGTFPKLAFQSLSASFKSNRAAFIEQNPPRNYVMQWNLNIQRDIGAGATVMIAYVGSHAVHNTFQTDDSDMVLPTKTPFGYLWPLRPPPPDNKSAPPTLPIFNTNFGRIALTSWNSSSLYHALEAQVKKRMGHGFEAQASYTFGRSIDSSSGSTDGDQFQNGLTSMLFFDQGFRRGLSDFNQSHKLEASFTWDVPNPKALTGALGWAASGWEFGGIFETSSGLPFTAVIAPDPLGMNSTDPFQLPVRIKGCKAIQGGVNYVNPNCFALPAQPAALAGQCQTFGFAFFDPTTTPLPTPASLGIAGTCENLLGSGGRNTLLGPGLVNLDFSLFKNNPIKRISEQFNVQFRMEIFNSLNHANYNPPTANNVVFDGSGVPVPGFGVLTGTATTSRQIQFALKFVW